MLFKYTAFLALLSAVTAIQITQPSDTTKWNGGEATTITWNSVSTDEDTFNLAIKDKNNQVTTIAEGVQTSSGSYSYTPAADMEGEFNVQILSAKSTQQNAILAESGFFEIAAGSNANAASPSSASASDDAAAASTSSGIPTKLTAPSANIQSAAASQTLSMAAGQNSPSAQATNGGTAAVPSGSAQPSGAATEEKKDSAACGLVPSLALIGGSLLALLA